MYRPRLALVEQSAVTPQALAGNRMLVAEDSVSSEPLDKGGRPDRDTVSHCATITQLPVTRDHDRSHGVPCNESRNDIVCLLAAGESNSDTLRGPKSGPGLIILPIEYDEDLGV